MYLFLDESGDLGFDLSKTKTTKHFVITLIFVSNKRSVEKIIKNIFSGFSKAERKRHNGVLHCYKEHKKTRTRILSNVKKLNIPILTIYLNKEKVYTRLKDEKQVLYNYVTNIVLDRVFSKRLIPIDDEIHLIAERRETNKFLNMNFKSYLESQISNNHKLRLKTFIKTPHSEKCLQVVDHISWAIFRKYEYQDDSYYNIIKDNILEENGLFK